MTELRQWQAEAFGRFLNNRGNFLVVATPGAGKTMFALTSAARLIELGEIRRIIVVVPTKHLRKQWAREAAAMGIQLDYAFVNKNGAIGGDFDGVVVTYSAVANERTLFRKLAADRTLVVLDEIHHGGDELPWGDALTLSSATRGRSKPLSPRPSTKKKTGFAANTRNAANCNTTWLSQ